MVALVLAIDKVTYAILYCVLIPECNLKKAGEILNKMLLINFWKQQAYIITIHTYINMITRVPHAGLHPSLHMIQLRFVDKSKYVIRLHGKL